MTDRFLVAFFAAALVAGLAYAVITPPFMVPDEWAHYLRSIALAERDVWPAVYLHGAYTDIPKADDELIAQLVHHRDSTFTLAQIRAAAQLPLDPHDRVTRAYAAWYTPAANAPQAIAAAAGRLFRLRPLVTFYLGRIVTVVIALLLVVMAMKIAPAWRLMLASVALIPMSMYELASWSADAMTIAAGILAAAFVLRAFRGPAFTRREWIGALAAAVLLGLCKPAYFLLPVLIAFAPAASLPRPRVARVAILIAAAAGVAASVVVAKHGFYYPRIGLPIEPGQQLRCILADPLRYALLVVHDFLAHRFYIEPLLGRLGWNDVVLPFALRAGVVLVLGVATFAGCEKALTPRERVLAIAAVAITAVGVVTSQYLIWTIVCAGEIEGPQGRYFLPLVPFFLAALAVRAKARVNEYVILAAMVLLNAWAIVILAAHFWRA